VVAVQRAKRDRKVSAPSRKPGNGAHILVVDDEEGMRELLSIMLLNDGHRVETATGVGEAERRLRGSTILEKERELEGDLPTIMITAYGSVDTAIKAMKKGAIDYIQKPFRNEEMRVVVKKALEHKRLKDENARLRAEQLRMGRLEEIVGKSQAIEQVRELIKRVAGLSSTVLIRGESGTGKELVARAIHRLSPRSERAFVAINCAGIPESLLESELFGHKKGAFTGAIENKKGLFEAAHHGTLLLDEIRPVGTAEQVAVDVRVISASNKDLEREVKEGRFRKDLFYRLNVIPITLPPLAERAEDIPLLANHFIKKYAMLLSKNVTSISPEAMSLLERFNWPGNIRQLENTVERAVALCNGAALEQEDLPRNIVEYSPEFHEEVHAVLPPHGVDLEQKAEALEKSLIAQALVKTQYSQKKAAELLNVPVRSLRYRLKKYGMSPLGQTEELKVEDDESMSQQRSSNSA